MSPQCASDDILQGEPLLKAVGESGIDLSTATSLDVARESGAPLNDWLSFDPDTLTFSGTPPSEYVGAVPVRFDVEGGAGVPTLSIITEVVVDETFTVSSNDSLSVIKDL